MNKKYVPAILTIAAIIIATFSWEKITLAYDIQNQIHGDYAINRYNANNDVLRFIFFISFPLIVFLLSYLTLNKERTVSLKQLILSKRLKTVKQKADSNYNLLFVIFITFLFAEFLSIDFNKFTTNLDFFHEGSILTPSSNSYLTKGLWSSSYVESGLFGSFGTLFLWKLFSVKTIGLTKLSELFLLLLNKILLVLLSKKISKNLLFSERAKISYFIILSILLISLVSYDYNIHVSEFPPKSFLFLLFFLIFFNSLYQSNKFYFSFFLLGTFSTISILWYIDIGTYINVLLLFILTYFLIRNEFKKCTSILFGIVFGWLTFIYIIPDHELKEFLNNTLLIYSTYDYIIGLIYPTPFLSGDTRSTKVLLLIILAGILVIIVNFNKNTKQTYYNKTLFIFLFIAALLAFKTGMMRSDTPHIKSASGFTLFLIYSLGLYFLFSFILDQNKKNMIVLKFSSFFEKNYTKLFLVFIILFFVILRNDVINFKNISSSTIEMTKLINYKDEKYLSSDYIDLVKYYKDLAREDKCVQILTNETALPYFLEKPTCTQFYLMWNSGPNQKKLVRQLKGSKPKIILYSSEIDPYNDVLKRTPEVIKYVNQNYSFHSKFKSWTFVKIN